MDVQALIVRQREELMTVIEYINFIYLHFGRSVISVEVKAPIWLREEDVDIGFLLDARIEMREKNKKGEIL